MQLNHHTTFGSLLLKTDFSYIVKSLH